MKQKRRKRRGNYADKETSKKDATEDEFSDRSGWNSARRWNLKIARVARETAKSARKDAETRCKRFDGRESPKFQTDRRRGLLYTGHVGTGSFAEQRHQQNDS